MTRMVGPAQIEALYRLHGPVAYRRARELLGSEIDARELVQEIFVQLLGDPGQYPRTSSFTTWLYSATTHRCLNRLRDERNRVRIMGERLEGAPQTLSPSRLEAATALRQLLQRLPEELGKVAVFYYLDGMSHEEIAGVIGCSRRHVGNLLERLRDWAQEYEESACS